MANENTFREIADKFNISESCGYALLNICLDLTLK